MTGGRGCAAATTAEDSDMAGCFGEKRSKWSEQRAIIVKKPEGPVSVRVGEVVFVPVEILN